jgi:hypothetical protein
VAEFHLSFFVQRSMSPRRVQEGRRRLKAPIFRRKLRKLIASAIRNVHDLEGFTFEVSW